ncbi:MAG: phosphatidylglycerol lysyltransferase domain-containing protein, partial [Paracoccaceae bacterium]
YKAPPRLAAAARRAGMVVMPLAREAWLDPCRFTLDHPARAALRRKLRKAAQAGVLAQCEAADPPQLARISTDWVTARGGEQGFSMGRFQADYLAAQRVYVARIGLRPVGFASFHHGPSGWALDLLRPAPDAPEGTAYALIAAALADAARGGVRCFSLAAASEPAFPDATGLLPRITARMPGFGPMTRGLWQFKQAFAPRWERLYLLAPSWPDMVLAGGEIRRAILHPPALAEEAQAQRPTAEVQNEIASDAAPWQWSRQRSRHQKGH